MVEADLRERRLAQRFAVVAVRETVYGAGIPARPERIEGYKAAMNGHRLAREVLVVNAPPTQRGGYDATRELLAEANTVTAIFAGNDMCAFGVLDALAELGMQVPQDMSVVGYDNTPVAAFQTISLTTVEQFATKIGAEAMQSVLARLKRRDRPAPPRHGAPPPHRARHHRAATRRHHEAVAPAHARSPTAETPDRPPHRQTPRPSAAREPKQQDLIARRSRRGRMD